MVVTTYYAKSLCYDEKQNITSGWKIWRGDFTGDAANPALGQRLASLPSWVLGETDVTRAVYMGRVVVLGLFNATMVLLAIWMWRSLGGVAALVACSLILTCPTVISHTAIVSTDGLGCVFMMLSVMAACEFWRRPQISGAIACGLATGCFLATKLTGTIWMFWLGCLWAYRLGSRARAGDYAFLFRWGGFGCVVMALIPFLIWFVYDFRYEALLTDQGLGREMFVGELGGRSLYGQLIRFVGEHRLLPERYVLGLYLLKLGRNVGYLLGENRMDGWWYYFPYCFGVKTPIVHLIVVGLAMWFAFRVFYKKHLLEDQKTCVIVIGGFGVLFGFSVLLTKYNIGVRHLIPLYMAAYVVAGIGAQQWVSCRGQRISIICVPVLLVGLGSLRGADHLEFFNVFAGGPKRGYRHLVDSNLDWGQDLLNLAEFVHERNPRKLWLQYFGTDDPRRFGLTADPFTEPLSSGRKPSITNVLSGGTYVVSATDLFGGYILKPYPEGIPLERWAELHRRLDAPRSNTERLVGEIDVGSVGDLKVRGDEDELAMRVELRAYQGLALLKRLRERIPTLRVGNTFFVFDLTDAEVGDFTSPFR